MATIWLSLCICEQYIFADTNYNPIPASLASLCTDMKTEDRGQDKRLHAAYNMRIWDIQSD